MKGVLVAFVCLLTEERSRSSRRTSYLACRAKQQKCRYRSSLNYNSVKAESEATGLIFTLQSYRMFGIYAPKPTLGTGLVRSALDDAFKPRSHQAMRGWSYKIGPPGSFALIRVLNKGDIWYGDAAKNRNSRTLPKVFSCNRLEGMVPLFNPFWPGLELNIVLALVLPHAS
jgi:hypothetical protein